MGLREILDRAEKVKPVAELNGKKVMSYEDLRDLTTAEINDPTVQIGVLDFNPDGTPRATPTRNVAVNLDHFYINRFKTVDKEIYLVRDYRAITEQSTGRVYLKRVPCYVIKRDAKGKLVLDRMVTVSDDEFIAEFTHILDHKSMAEILPLLTNGTETTHESLTI